MQEHTSQMYIWHDFLLFDKSQSYTSLEECYFAAIKSSPEVKWFS